MTWLQGAGVIITMCGVVVVAIRGDLRQLATVSINPGDALMFLACVFYAGYTVALRNRPHRRRLGYSG